MTKVITDHHDGHGLTEAIEVRAADDPGPGGAHHLYTFTINGQEVGRLQFQKGPRDEAGSTPGVLSVAVLASLIDIHRDFQAGPYPSREGTLALTKMQEALHWLKARADERAARAVLGLNQP